MEKKNYIVCEDMRGCKVTLRGDRVNGYYRNFDADGETVSLGVAMCNRKSLQLGKLLYSNIVAAEYNGSVDSLDDAIWNAMESPILIRSHFDRADLEDYEYVLDGGKVDYYVEKGDDVWVCMGSGEVVSFPNDVDQSIYPGKNLCMLLKEAMFK